MIALFIIVEDFSRCLKSNYLITGSPDTSFIINDTCINKEMAYEILRAKELISFSTG